METIIYILRALGPVLYPLLAVTLLVFALCYMVS